MNVESLLIELFSTHNVHRRLGTYKLDIIINNSLSFPVISDAAKLPY